MSKRSVVWCAVVLFFVTARTVSGSEDASPLQGSWASPVEDMGLETIKQAYAVYTFHPDGKVELLQFGSVIPTKPGDYGNHILLSKKLGEYKVKGDTVTISGMELDHNSWTFELKGNELHRKDGQEVLPVLTKAAYVSRAK